MQERPTNYGEFVHDNKQELKPAEIKKYQHPYFTYDFVAKQLEINGRRVHLSEIETNLLEYLIVVAPNLISNEKLNMDVWADNGGKSGNVKLYIHYLRRRFTNAGGNDPIINRHGMGYRLRTAKDISHQKSKDAEKIASEAVA